MGAQQTYDLTQRIFSDVLQLVWTNWESICEVPSRKHISKHRSEPVPEFVHGSIQFKIKKPCPSESRIKTEPVDLQKILACAADDDFFPASIRKIVHEEIKNSKKKYRDGAETSVCNMYYPNMYLTASRTSSLADAPIDGFMMGNMQTNLNSTK